LRFADRIGFCGRSLLRDLGSFLGSKKGKKGAKIAKRFFFCSFCIFLPFCFLKECSTTKSAAVRRFEMFDLLTMSIL
jgi:hypothetical protein